MRNKTNVIRQANKILTQYQPDRTKNSLETNVMAIAEKLNITVVPYAFSEDISGVFFRKDNRLFLGVNNDHHEHRQRFTIAHEIGHYVLHSLDTIHYDIVDQEKVFYRAKDISSVEEREANIFAAELLMPEETVEELIAKDITSINLLASTFNVSEDAMRYRLINLGYL